MKKIIRLTESDLIRIVKRVINEQQGTVYRLRDLEKQGYHITAGGIPPKGNLKDSGIEVLANTKTAADTGLQQKLNDMGIEMRNTKIGYPLYKEEPDRKIRVKWFEVV